MLAYDARADLPDAPTAQHVCRLMTTVTVVTQKHIGSRARATVTAVTQKHIGSRARAVIWPRAELPRDVAATPPGRRSNMTDSHGLTRVLCHHVTKGALKHERAWLLLPPCCCRSPPHQALTVATSTSSLPQPRSALASRSWQPHPYIPTACSFRPHACNAAPAPAASRAASASGGRSMGAGRGDRLTSPSWPHAAISSSPLLARTVQGRPAARNTARKARTSSSEDLKQTHTGGAVHAR